MSMNPRQLLEILDLLRSKNNRSNASFALKAGKDVAKMHEQIVSPAEKVVKGIPTLERNNYKNLTPLLDARFRYSGSWREAVIGTSLLSVSEMENVWDNARIIEQIRIRQENWEDSPPRIAAWENISLFAIDLENYDEVYLIWDSAEEPRVAAYINNYDEWFENIGDFFLFYSTSPE